MSSASVPDHQPLEIFIDARLSHSRLVSERASGIAPGPGHEQRSVNARAEQSSQIEIGLYPANAPSTLTVTLSYSVSIKAEGVEQAVGDYECRYFAAFRITRSSGIVDWNALPLDVIAPYAAITVHQAVRRAESTFQEMGINGGPLPRPEFGEGTFATSAVAS